MKKSNFRSLQELYRRALKEWEISKEELVTEFDILEDVSENHKNLSSKIDSIAQDKLYDLK